MSSTRHIRRRLAALLALAMVALAPGAALAWKMEAGTITLPNTYSGSPVFTSFSFQQTYDTPPLVFLLPTRIGENPAAIRIRNVTTTGFEAAVVEPHGEDGPHIQMTVAYLAIEPGVHTLPDGTLIEAGTVSTTRVQRDPVVGGPQGWEQISLTAGFADEPVVLAQIQTLANETRNPPATYSEPWLTAVVDEVEEDELRVALERSEASDGTVTQIASAETIAWLAIEAGARGTF
ncbi:MAG TPA: agglutinin biogenesis protein MshQ, partial [Chromatiales bacterium]|nr:agglutinin biogenesis protein MshQ [Chromatiales bacterium]